MTIYKAYIDFTDQLKIVYDVREAANIADWVFESVAGIKRLDRITNKHKELSNSAIDQLTGKLQQLLQHKPVQYVLGEAWFYKMKFFVDNSVLIPRPETEELVEWIVTEFKSKEQGLKIIDIGTGSGCIGIALKKELPAADIVAIDLSAEALSIARQNAAELKANIKFLQVNFLDEGSWDHYTSFDVIVSNPPYISVREMSKIKKNVIDYEPHLALFTENSAPFIFYEKIALFAQHHLNEDGKIYVEVHEKFADEVEKIFVQNALTPITRKDIYGRDRMMKAYR